MHVLYYQRRLWPHRWNVSDWQKTEYRLINLLRSEYSFHSFNGLAHPTRYCFSVGDKGGHNSKCPQWTNNKNLHMNLHGKNNNMEVKFLIWTKMLSLLYAQIMMPYEWNLQCTCMSVLLCIHESHIHLSFPFRSKRKWRIWCTKRSSSATSTPTACDCRSANIELRVSIIGSLLCTIMLIGIR